NSASARSNSEGPGHATERRGRCVKATAPETASTSNRSCSAAPADDMATAAETRTTEASSHSSAAAVRVTLRLPNEGRTRKKRDPTQYSFHDFDFLCIFVGLFLRLNISLG